MFLQGFEKNNARLDDGFLWCFCGVFVVNLWCFVVLKCVFFDLLKFSCFLDNIFPQAGFCSPHPWPGNCKIGRTTYCLSREGIELEQFPRIGASFE